MSGIYYLTSALFVGYLIQIMRDSMQNKADCSPLAEDDTEQLRDSIQNEIDKLDKIAPLQPRSDREAALSVIQNTSSQPTGYVPNTAPNMKLFLYRERKEVANDMPPDVKQQENYTQQNQNQTDYRHRAQKVPTSYYDTFPNGVIVDRKPNPMEAFYMEPNRLAHAHYLYQVNPQKFEYQMARSMDVKPQTGDPLYQKPVHEDKMYCKRRELQPRASAYDAGILSNPIHPQIVEPAKLPQNEAPFGRVLEATVPNLYTAPYIQTLVEPATRRVENQPTRVYVEKSVYQNENNATQQSVHTTRFAHDSLQLRPQPVNGGLDASRTFNNILDQQETVTRNRTQLYSNVVVNTGEVWVDNLANRLDSGSLAHRQTGHDEELARGEIVYDIEAYLEQGKKPLPIVNVSNCA